MTISLRYGAQLAHLFFLKIIIKLVVKCINFLTFETLKLHQQINLEKKIAPLHEHMQPLCNRIRFSRLYDLHADHHTMEEEFEL